MGKNQATQWADYVGWRAETLERHAKRCALILKLRMKLCTAKLQNDIVEISNIETLLRQLGVLV